MLTEEQIEASGLDEYDKETLRSLPDPDENDIWYIKHLREHPEESYDCEDDDDEDVELPEDTGNEAINEFNKWLNQSKKAPRKKVHRIVI